MAMSRSRASKDQFKLHGQELEKRTKAVTNQGLMAAGTARPMVAALLANG